MFRMVAIGLLSLFLVACSSTRDISNAPGAMTDYVVGQSYQLKQSVFLQNGTLNKFFEKELENRFRTKKPSWIDGIIEASTPITIRKIEVSRAPELGKWTDVYAEIEKGAFKGRVIEISTISKRIPSGATFRDSNILEPIKAELRLTPRD